MKKKSGVPLVLRSKNGEYIQPERILTEEQLAAWKPYMTAIKEHRAWRLSMDMNPEFGAQTDLILLYMINNTMN